MLVIVVGYIAVRAAIVTVTMPARVRAFQDRRAQNKARTTFADALRNYFEGRFGKAERAARTALELGEQPALAGVLAAKGVKTFYEFRPAAITLGPNTTLYFSDHPTLVTRVHEAIHRRQMRDKSVVGRLMSALRYKFDYSYRLDEEAEAKA